MSTTAAVVDALVAQLVRGYVFPARARQAAELVRAKLQQDAYSAVLGPALCEQISADLFRSTQDKHLRLIWHESPDQTHESEHLVAALREQFRLENQGVRRVERLAGNIGLLELTVIPEAAAAGAAIAAAMELVRHTHALIVDLRAARGGSPDGVTLLASYLVPGGGARLSDVVEGPGGGVRQYWTSDYLPGPRYGDLPVYLLTSRNTFSGAESLAYDLQALGRVCIVGESTRGGAHPSDVVALTEHIELRLPVARTVNPITGGNWEGVGVQPDVAAAADDALEIAYRAALEAIAGSADLPAASRAEAIATLQSLPTGSPGDPGA
jgi:C-terminal processing protease CtpA/Prc